MPQPRKCAINPESRKALKVPWSEIYDMTRILSTVLIVAFMSGIVSPACAKLWGNAAENFLEICTGQGLQKISLNDADNAKDNSNTNQDFDENCLFCSSFANALVSSPSALYFSGHVILPIRVQAQESAYTKIIRTFPESRAPPISFKI